MNAEEKILGGILEEAEATAAATAEKAANEVKDLEEAAAAEAKTYSAEAISSALLKAKAIKQNAESSAELTVRDAKLAKKHEEINKTLDMAIASVCALSDEKYFTLMAGVAAAYAKEGEGTLQVGKKDIRRDLSVFKKALSDKGVKITVSDIPSSDDYGFVLCYGDVEYNLSLAALINDKRDILEDRIHRILFN